VGIAQECIRGPVWQRSKDARRSGSILGLSSPDETGAATDMASRYGPSGRRRRFVNRASCTSPTAADPGAKLVAERTAHLHAPPPTDGSARLSSRVSVTARAWLLRLARTFRLP